MQRRQTEVRLTRRILSLTEIGLMQRILYCVYASIHGSIHIIYMLKKFGQHRFYIYSYTSLYLTMIFTNPWCILLKKFQQRFFLSFFLSEPPNFPNRIIFITVSSILIIF